MWRFQVVYLCQFEGIWNVFTWVIQVSLNILILGISLDLHEEEHTGNTNSGHTGAFGIFYPLGRHNPYTQQQQLLTSVRQLPSVICHLLHIYHLYHLCPCCYVLICVNLCACSLFMCIYIYGERNLVIHVSYCFTADFRAVLYQQC